MKIRGRRKKIPGIEIKSAGGGSKIIVYSPYNPEFVKKARKLGGKWSTIRVKREPKFHGDQDYDLKQGWIFDARNEEFIRAILVEAYGHDGSPTKVADITYTVEPSDVDDKKLHLFGRLLLERRYRDYNVSPGEGVVIIDDQFPSSGGSQKYPRIDGAGSKLLIRDVPVSLIEEAFSKWPEKSLANLQVPRAQEKSNARRAEREQDNKQSEILQAELFGDQPSRQGLVYVPGMGWLTPDQQKNVIAEYKKALQRGLVPRGSKRRKHSPGQRTLF